MQFKVTSVVLSALAAIASAQNAFNIPAGGYALTAGTASTFSWSSLAGSTVTISLRQGPSNNLGAPIVIAQSIPNSGSFTWNVPSTLVQGSDYALEIVDDQDTSKINFTPQFTITSSVKSSAGVSSSTVAPVTTSAATLTTTFLTTAPIVTASTGTVPPVANGTFTTSKPSATSGPGSSTSPSAPFATGAAGTIAISAGAGIAALVAGFVALF